MTYIYLIVATKNMFAAFAVDDEGDVTTVAPKKAQEKRVEVKPATAPVNRKP